MNPALLLRALTAGLVTALLLVSPARLIPSARAQTLDKVSFGTNWVAEAEHGGFFQAAADGTYRKYGLDVTIVPGGPNDNNRMLLVAGKIDFFMAANTLMSFDAVANNVPVVTIAAVFQKDPQVLLTHPELKITKLEELKPLTLLVSKEGISSYFQWLKSEYGFNEKNVRPYTFNPQPFIANAQTAMQGYVTSEPFAIEKSAGFKPGIILLADHGFNTYSVAKMKEYGIVDSGDSLRNGIGAMTDDRIASFFNKMVKAGVVRPDIDFRKAYTLRFVNKGVGLDLRPKNQ